DYLQLRWLFQAPDGNRGPRLHRFEQCADRPCHDRGRCNRCGGKRGKPRCCRRGTADGTRGADGEVRLGGPFPRCNAQEEGGGEESLMCGIIGIVGKGPVAERLVSALRRMEYRGYDSAGLCVIEGGDLVRRRAEGKLANLVAELEARPTDGEIGIAHTRWATHGPPTTQNAHPHA